MQLLDPLFVLVFLAFQNVVYAWFRVPCTSPLVHDRIDPIVSPGVIPSNHIHTVHGASNFAANSTYETLRQSQCTSCRVAQDLSNYWFARLYFQDPQTGQFEAVANGGLLVYYLNRGSGDKSNGGPGLHAFPAGFTMTSGDPTARSNSSSSDPQQRLRIQAVEFDCLRYPSDQGYNGYGFPTTDCEAGLNARIHMPACWDGVNLDSPDHMSHTAYLSGLDNGDCPSTHPVPLLELLYEVTWNVHDFANRWSPGRDPWPFVYSTGDPTGFSWHGDFQNGWDIVALQNAIDQCNNASNPTGSGVTEACSFLTVVNASVASTCNITAVVDEPTETNLTNLPGCNPIQPGPNEATLYSDSNCPSSSPELDNPLRAPE
ncbi:hypothetical protein BDN72DRAFT_888685 [Pluteus cervinus]|uniref:Uncharacterized protein n=1 Tax=Pluteus cervinus TaxID=181527 RepID=A0ACD3AQH6_9AGAR|nr:hypothetical protein BDN72DRAFT_888685 [Pluteus cervinus]